MLERIQNASHTCSGYILLTLQMCLTHTPDTSHIYADTFWMHFQHVLDMFELYLEAELYCAAGYMLYFVWFYQI